MAEAGEGRIKISDSAGFAWGHVNLNLSALERSIAFYAEFGFEVFLPAIPYLGLARDHASALAEEPARALGLPPSGFTAGG